MKKISLLLLTALLALTSQFLPAQNNYLSFDGSDDYVSVPDNSSIDLSLAMTIEFWIYITSNDGTWQEVISKSTSDAVENFRIAVDPDNNYVYFDYGNGTQNAQTSAFTINLNTWYHMAFSVEASSAGKIYVNGVEASSYSSQAAAAGSIPTNNELMEIGVSTNIEGGRYFHGYLDEVRIWSSVRSETEIRLNIYREIPDPTSESSLEAYYQLNSDLTDASSNTNNGTFNNGTATHTTSPAMFGPKNALDFDGSNDYVTIPDHVSLDLTNNYTIEAWIYPHSFNDKGGIVSKYHTASANGYLLRLTSTSPFSGLTLNEVSTSNGVLSANTWYHVAGVVDGGSVIIYVDGIEQSVSGTALSVISNSDPVRIGVDYITDPRYFNGLIDEVRIWSDVRTEQEIIENMCISLTGNEDGLRAYYTFDNISGNDLQDFALDDESLNDGSLQNMDNTDWVSSSAFNTWLNSSSTSWATGSNWSDGAEPTSTDNVGIPDHDGSQPTISSALSCNNLVVGIGATLTDNYSAGTHSAGKNVIVNGDMDVKGGNLLNVTKSLIITNTGNLDVDPLGKVTVANDMKVNGSGTCTLNSSDAGSGSLIVYGAATGNIVIERYIDRWSDAAHGWHFLSSPIADYVIENNFTATPATNYDFYAWSEVNDIWVNYKNTTTSPTFLEVNGSTTFELGQAYLVAYSAESTKNFTGTPSNSDITESGLTFTEESDHTGWHLLGNPFPSALLWYATTGSWDLTNVNTTAKIWNESGASYTDISQNGAIPATQGFMVNVSSATNSITIPRDDRSHNSQAWYKGEEINKIKLTAYDPEGSMAQETIIRFNAGAIPEFEDEHDSRFLSGYAPFLYSLAGDICVSTNTLPELTEELTIPLYFIKNSSSTFYIEAEGLDNLIPSYPVYLTDLQINYTHNLTTNPVYSFFSEEGDDPARFLLHFNAVGIDEEENISHNNIQVWSTIKTIHILNPDNLKGQISILNLFGQKVIQTTLTGDTKQHIQLSVPTGCYLVNVISDEGVVTRKVFVGN